MILSACYMLWLYQRVFFGKASEDLTHHMPDLNFREYAIIVPLILLMVWMGTFTQSFLPPISASNAVLLGPDRRKPRDSRARLRRRPPRSQPQQGASRCPLTSCPRATDYLRFLPEIIMTVGRHADHAAGGAAGREQKDAIFRLLTFAGVRRGSGGRRRGQRQSRACRFRTC